MRYLVYGIMPEAEAAAGLPARVGEGHVSVLVDGGLAAVYSLISEACATPDTAALLGYAGVVQALRQLGTVLPMRYGCLLDSTEQILELLRRRRQVFHAALDQVAGCVEMGLRVLAGQAALPDNPPDPLPAGATPPAGATYLSRRAARYARRDGCREESQRLAESLQAALTGLFVKCHVEPAARPQGILVSIHFLVRAGRLNEFGEAFHRLAAARREKLLLTGPWPPYNFVDPNL